MKIQTQTRSRMKIQTQTRRWIAVAAASLATLAGCDRNEQLTMEVIKSAQPVSGGPDAAGRHVATNSQPPAATSSTAGTDATSMEVLAQNSAPGAGQSAGPLSDFDRRFLAAVAEEGMYEEAMARLATQMSSDPMLKAFAATLLERRIAVNEKLKQLAARHRVALPPALPPARQTGLEKLGGAKGAALDAQLTQAARQWPAHAEASVRSVCWRPRQQAACPVTGIGRAKA